MSDAVPTKPKSSKDKGLAPVISYDEFLARTNLSTVWAEGLELDLTLRGGTLPRPLAEWQKALDTFQASA